jgi:hypothetical protein
MENHDVYPSQIHLACSFGPCFKHVRSASVCKRCFILTACCFDFGSNCYPWTNVTKWLAGQPAWHLMAVEDLLNVWGRNTLFWFFFCG